MKNLSDLLMAFGHRREDQPPASARVERCPECQVYLMGAEDYERFRVCPSCRHHFAIPARERVDQLADPGSFREVNRSLSSVDPLSFSDKLPYRQRLTEAKRKTGLADAVVTGLARIGGHPAVLAVMDFDFLGGSMGSVVGEKIALAFELAVKEKVPMVVVATSGGARMQEGMLSLAQMAKTAAAAQRLHACGLPYISVLANPTTGGVYASFANLADVILAEPRALVGFAGPRVVEQTMGTKLPPGTDTAEFQLRHGMVDRIVDRARQRDLLSVLLELLMARERLVAVGRGGRHASDAERPATSAWKTVQLARHEQRPTALDYIGRIFSNYVELHGDRLFADDPAVVGGLADLNGLAVVVVGQERGHGTQSADRNEGRARPEGYRKALRLMNLAAKFHLPLLTLIDTPGAYVGLESEEHGLAVSLAQCLARLSELPTPVLAAVIGEGGSGGALALGVADRVLMLEHAIYSVIAPEGAAAIIYRDAGRAEEVAPSLKLTSHDCRELGVVDVVVSEPEGGAHLDHDRAAWLLRSALVEQLLQVQAVPVNQLVKARYRKYRRMGEYGSYFREAMARELSQFQDYLGRRLGDLRERWERRGPEGSDGGTPPPAGPE